MWTSDHCSIRRRSTNGCHLYARNDSFSVSHFTVTLPRQKGNASLSQDSQAQFSAGPQGLQLEAPRVLSGTCRDTRPQPRLLATSVNMKTSGCTLLAVCLPLALEVFQPFTAAPLGGPSVVCQDDSGGLFADHHTSHDCGL